mgnify:CR=1 FL=1
MTPTALELGITLPCHNHPSALGSGNSHEPILSEEDQTGRLRDILMAFRLRLASLTDGVTAARLSVLLTLPPSTVPQPVPLFALINRTPHIKRT